ncbi:hypothetical protein, partial [Pseudomonas aeruginosa]|uniref:hypothetical protein n=1 Tax=Pseudomonas aeruginosa TaxID=287 RepID=UPI001F1C3AD5
LQVLNLLVIDRTELFIRAACELFLANNGALDCVAVALNRHLAVTVAGDRGATAAFVRVLGRIALPVSPAITTATRAAAIAITAASSTVSVSPAGAAIAAARSAITATACTATSPATIATTSSTAITTRVFRVGRVCGIGRRLHARGA